ncbi:MAG: hypothetical protein NC300_12450 [Bacteroidales bacterium]|nr:hypothetical protein [Bacteroidales bacterium]MCM1220370.1 hypothetical protein [Lachnospiraceae bacterium]
MKKMKIVTAAVGILCTVMVCTLVMGRLFIRASEIEEGENDVEALEPYITEEQENSGNQQEEIIIQEETEDLYYQGLIYYLNSYQNECEMIYLQSCLEYASLEEEIGRKRYDMGEITPAEVKAYEAKRASVEAQLAAAENQRNYYGLFLKENGLDYADYPIKETKDVKSSEYYIGQYPAKNHMTMAGYVTNYQNALAYLEAKKIETEYLTMQTDSAKHLYDAGEISTLELKQQEVSLAKAIYEQEQYYVEMNLAYANLLLYCR